MFVFGEGFLGDVELLDGVTGIQTLVHLLEMEHFFPLENCDGITLEEEKKKDI